MMEKNKDNKERRRRNKRIKMKRMYFLHDLSLKRRAKGVEHKLLNLKPRVQSRVN
jgi:hypothetical protein